jgi:hypothetical protein
LIWRILMSLFQVRDPCDVMLCTLLELTQPDPSWPAPHFLYPEVIFWFWYWYFLFIFGCKLLLSTSSYVATYANMFNLCLYSFIKHYTMRPPPSLCRLAAQSERVSVLCPPSLPFTNRTLHSLTARHYLLLHNFAATRSCSLPTIWCRQNRVIRIVECRGIWLASTHPCAATRCPSVYYLAIAQTVRSYIRTRSSPSILSCCTLIRSNYLCHQIISIPHH